MKDSILDWSQKLSKVSKPIFSQLPEKLQGTLKVRAFSLFNVPLLFLASPRVILIDDHCCQLMIPFRKLVKNHLGSLYFGAFAIAADACIGLAAFDEIDRSEQPISLIFKSFKADFIKRAEGDTLFVFNEKKKMRAFVEEVAMSRERISQAFTCEAFVNQDKVATFELTLSLKRR